MDNTIIAINPSSASPLPIGKDGGLLPPVEGRPFRVASDMTLTPIGALTILPSARDGGITGSRRV
jgi:hypothetical protein